MSPDLSRLRLTVVGVVVLSLFSALFARLWYLQVLDAQEFQVKATANQVRTIYTEAPRGRILDRNMKVLVDNRVSEAVTVNRLAVKDRPDVVERLAAVLNVAPAELQGRIDDPNVSPYKPVAVADDVSEELVVYLREHAADFPGVEVTPLARRNYPNGSLAAHLLGYVGELNDTELAEHRREGYRLGDTIGKAGVEKVYEAALRGRPGVLQLEVDRTGRVLRTIAERAPVAGHDVQLTVDLDVQRVAEESLTLGLAAARNRLDRNDLGDGRKPYKAPAGSAVVLDPRDGSVIALASAPTFDPSAFVNGISETQYQQLTDPAAGAPLNNRAITGEYAPGSTFKLVTATAAVAKGIITPERVVLDGGRYVIPGCRGGLCSKRNAGGKAYGRVNLTRAITVSSDVYFYALGAQFWFERSRVGDGIQETARSYGFGAPTGIPLPGERRGRIPDPESRKKLHEAKPKAFPEGKWFAGDNVNLAIGQGETVVTPIQLANAYATFANGGTVHQPNLLARVVDARGDGSFQEVSKAAPKVAGRVDIPANARPAMDAGFRGVIASREGTAAAAFAGFPLSRFPVAGKTGTAQVARKQDTAVFAAYGPEPDPSYALAVVMEEAGFGGTAAAPVARRIFEQLAGQPLQPIATGAGID